MDEETLRRVATIAHVDLNGEETDAMLAMAQEVEGLLGILDEFRAGEATPRFSPIRFVDVLRDDVPEPYQSEKLLDGMDAYEGYVRGPKVV
ncbi:MAG: hypothetical protein GX224_03565 [Thermoplasmatales archaeon]|nr:hypothetical protein [Thermoplasmatales archaeon]